VALPLFAKVALSGFLLGNHEKIAVVANAGFYLFYAKMPPMTICLKGHRNGSRRRGNESLISSHLRFTISDLRSYTPYRVNRISSIENFWNPRSFAPLCDSNPVFEIKELSQTVKTQSSNPIKSNQGFLMKKFRIFFRSLLWKIIGKSAKNNPKKPSKYLKKHAVFDVFFPGPIYQ